MLKLRIASVLLFLSLAVGQGIEYLPVLDGRRIKYLKSVFAWTRSGWHHVKNPYTCPSSHRFAFDMGTKCCRHNMEGVRSDSEELSAEISAELSSILEGKPDRGDAYYGYDDNATYGDDYGQLRGLIATSGCDGGRIFYDSKCCKRDEFVECTHPNYTMTERPFSCIDGRVCMTLSNQTCLFPFNHLGNLVSHCVGKKWENNGWCATDVTLKNRDYTKWGYCQPGCTEEDWS